METILTVQQLNKKYKQQYALKNVSLHIRKGEIYGLIGRNGAGKTTLLKAITRLIAPTNGQIALFGSSTDKEWTNSLKRTGAVIETPSAYDQLTAEQNLAYYCKLRGIVQSKQVIKETLELVDLTDTGRQELLLRDEAKAGHCDCHFDSSRLPNSRRTNQWVGSDRYRRISSPRQTIE